MNLTILQTKVDLDNWLQQQINYQIYLVPTMGGLHKGHKKLINAAKTFPSLQPSKVLVTIFVNPLQFAADEDFDQYPRTLDSDYEAAYEAGANAVWAPRSTKDVFPDGKGSQFKIKAPSHLQKNLCGATRKNHFDGVGTVVIRLLRMISPNRIFLGEKDWQQLIIIRQLIQDLDLPVKVSSIGTVRDNDGLPYSSRNKYLTKNERKRAIALPNLLLNAAQIFQESQNIDLNKIRSSLIENKLEIEYLETVDFRCLTPINNNKNKSLLLAAAVRCGNTRIIDHTFLMTRNPIVAIDGPAGAGKSTVTKIFAKRLGLIYLDTGAMYRAATLLIQENDIDIENKDDLLKLLENFNLDIQLTDNDDQVFLLNGIDITKQIRSPKVTSQVSLIAQNSSIRDKLTYQQKELGKRGGLVAEGRDIGTQVFPEADLKIFLTASTKERAKRRAIDLQKQGFNVEDLSEIERSINERDTIDSRREISPLLKAKDAKELITDGMEIDLVIEVLIDMFRERVPEEIWPKTSI